MHMFSILYITTLLNWLTAIGGGLQVERQGAYTYMHADSCTVEAWEYTPDSILLVQTSCIPLCSSCARVINKEGKTLYTITPPFPHAVLPYATLDSGRVVWEDRTYQILDEQERKYNTPANAKPE